MQKTASITAAAQLWRAALEQFERIRYLFELIGATVVGAGVMALLLHILDKGSPL